jgi:uncharacterized membrane protein
MTDLGTLSGDSSGIRINGMGAVTGQSNYFAHYTAPFLWKEGIMISLGSGNTVGDHGHGVNINDAEQVIGDFGSHGPPTFGFVWKDGITTILAPVGNDQSSHVVDSNNAGEVAGYSYTYAGELNAPPHHGFVWKDGTFWPLPPLAGDSSVPAAINGPGQVAGTSAGLAVLWTPKTEPVTPSPTQDSTVGETGCVTLADAVSACRVAYGKTLATQTELVRLDIAPLDENRKPMGDGKIDAADVVILLRHLAGLVAW